MTEDNRPTASIDSSTTKQRKKRKWDVPAMPLVATGVPFPGTFPAPVRPTIPGFQVPLLQHSVTLAQKLILPKVQDELISREIIINDADSSIRYKLTKRQTQEEIQNCTGAVVITRGIYKPQNAPNDGEKPLYLHISAGSHLETTIERIKAVDSAALMVEEMLKQDKVDHMLSTCVYLGFEADPYMNIPVRIRGPNDQYINHIMNETGASVLLKGYGSGSENEKNEVVKKPIHLFISSNNPRSLEQAKLLAQNLLDTIKAECSTRDLSSKVYGAVPPPRQLMTGVQHSNMPPVNTTVTQSVGPTSYNGYAGIYTQATPVSSVGPTPKLQKSSPKKRKFQELPVAVKGPTSFHQGSKLGKTCELTSDVGPVIMPPVKNIMAPPPPPKSMPLVPPPSNRVKISETVPDTLVKLMEYGDDDDDDDDDEEEIKQSDSKPFWAI